MNQFQMVYIAHGTLWTLRTRNLDARATAAVTATGMQAHGRSLSSEIPNAEGSSAMGTTTRARHPFGIARVVADYSRRASFPVVDGRFQSSRPLFDGLGFGSIREHRHRRSLAYIHITYSLKPLVCRLSRTWT